MVLLLLFLNSVVKFFSFLLFLLIYIFSLTFIFFPFLGPILARAKTESKDRKIFLTNVPEKNKKIIRVLKGPQYDYFSKESQKEFFSKEYKISNLTDRMGMRLEGTVLKNIISTNIRSEGITKGAIQVPADGQPIILLTEYPTIGGYPKIANVTSVDYNLLIQKTPGEKIFFELIKLREAEQLYKEHLKSISEVIKNIKEII